MKLTFKIFSVFLLLLVIACGEKEEKESIKLSEGQSSVKKEVVEKAATTTAEVDNMQNKGIGPISQVVLNDELDQAMVTRGEELFKNMCSACHKMDKKFVGPSLAGVTERRAPEWIMNMILNPQTMIQQDPIAKKLLVESNMAVMANQNLSEEETRAILEYFRHYDLQN
ncbi:c-type cytochrome [Salinimicrobium oceani]|uniref:Cytochrome c n=1 Tax=Salinimicrobium oceani TaxID=2722702 RepID=A0ABX1D0T9_9FLAO|nr:cytochrome c [Salinimicrobium oceani]NJW53249.1 cytochrome c [Salinimicrobium oceani]